MPDAPTICCILLTRDRPEMAARAVRCFQEQTYPQKILVVWNTGQPWPEDLIKEMSNTPAAWYLEPDRIIISPRTIGALRNEVLTWVTNGPRPIPEIILHLDDDDYSHPNRIAEQVALLQSSGAECVGYREMLFWQDRCKHPGQPIIDCDAPGVWHGTGLGPYRCDSEAWLYTNNDPRYCLGTSLCYWRKTWERRPFPDLPKTKGGTGEDTEWLREVRSVGVPAAFCPYESRGRLAQIAEVPASCEIPLMIATIHGGNSQHYEPAKAPMNWKRVPEWDARVREIMENA